MYLFGGGDCKPSSGGLQVYALNLKSKNWEVVQSKGKIPQDRVAHTCVLDENTGQIFLWGGFTSSLERLQDLYVLDFGSMKWGSISTPKEKPSCRAFHASCIYNGSMFIFGGANGERRHSDIWEYQIRYTPPSLMALAAKAIAKMPAVAENGDNKYSVPPEVLDGLDRAEEGSDWFQRSRQSSFNALPFCRESVESVAEGQSWLKDVSSSDFESNIHGKKNLQLQVFKHAANRARRLSW
eukprot:CAMPEP_0113942160 /NCGR_PEP_ID=MMETSP1339-20121228/7927_1 /TAXON_ID=94617 /ORGANISM="Fibrocapsa japonica" /LENGTH=238 /DNA_ID=CAMNT_0000946521 /DNA_START=296 /DNA_END=1009 /DNA_ORIENTATION=+ /assembly_acc=CAM_ASM_000762